MSYRVSLAPKRRAAIRTISGVRHALLAALEAEARESGLNQAEIARRLGVHRSVINRTLTGGRDFTVGRVAELAWAIGGDLHFSFVKTKEKEGSNTALLASASKIEAVSSSTSAVAKVRFPPQIAIPVAAE